MTSIKKIFEADPPWGGARSGPIEFDFDVVDVQESPDNPRSVREIAREHGVKIVKINPDGPGGGNPQVFAKAPDLKTAREFVAHVYGIDRDRAQDMADYVDPIFQGIAGDDDVEDL